MRGYTLGVFDKISEDDLKVVKPQAMKSDIVSFLLLLNSSVSLHLYKFDKLQPDCTKEKKSFLFPLLLLKQHLSEISHFISP